MKKLVMMVTALAMAVVANAGAVNWKIYDVDGPDAGYAYLFTDATSITDVQASVLAGSFFTDYASDAVYTGEIDGGEYLSGKILDGVYSGNTTLWMLALDSDATGYTQYIISNDEGVTMNIGTSGTKSFEFTYGDNLTAWTPVGGSPVPEPTSGLLMLLGMAGLALRRRRA